MADLVVPAVWVLRALRHGDRGLTPAGVADVGALRTHAGNGPGGQGVDHHALLVALARVVARAGVPAVSELEAGLLGRTIAVDAAALNRGR